MYTPKHARGYDSREPSLVSARSRFIKHTQYGAHKGEPESRPTALDAYGTTYFPRHSLPYRADITGYVVSLAECRGDCYARKVWDACPLHEPIAYARLRARHRRIPGVFWGGRAPASPMQGDSWWTSFLGGGPFLRMRKWEPAEKMGKTGRWTDVPPRG